MKIIIDGEQRPVPPQWHRALEAISQGDGIRFHSVAVAKDKPRTTALASATIHYRDVDGKRVPHVTTLDNEAQIVDLLTKSFLMEFMTLDYIEFVLDPADDAARALKAAQTQTPRTPEGVSKNKKSLAKGAREAA